jgi:hypothetical protein
VGAERFLNSYHNASTPPGPDVPAELAAFMLAVDPVLTQAAELARVLARAHQGAATQLIGEDWSHARKYFSLSEKYAEWADYQQPAMGYGIHAYAHKVRRPVRLTDGSSGHIRSGATSAPRRTGILRCGDGWLFR